MTTQNNDDDDDDDDDDGDDDDEDDNDEDHGMITSAQATFRPIRECTQPDDRIQNIYLT